MLALLNDSFLYVFILVFLKKLHMLVALNVAPIYIIHFICKVFISILVQLRLSKFCLSDVAHLCVND